ncbi:hypothetical protein ELG69_16295 [Rhizobium leguminosarum]|uniref:hypothetical protein n=1 Tax=Rhizobium leguminosarum TaxID=384 RepID=UPI0010317508|nr:hypothetical protein [Rhizobium leguminosarum]TBG85550.1 hypothetical protein ELG69_16295 [Rhizobium leguminosarum]
MLDRPSFARQGSPQSKIDVAAVVGQFLAEVSLTDLVVELVQNDLDAGATRTVITFGKTALVSEGNGDAIEPNGWKRLGYVLGAGGEVEAKKDGIGSKNHGLRSLFLLADDVWLQSGGYRADLTARGRSDAPKEFYPASWDRVEDPGAPSVGTRITAEYRTERMRKPDGDGAYLEPPSAEMLDELWSASADEAPERFVAASAPGKAWRYELVLQRAGRPSRTFTFECKRLEGSLKTLFLRSCKKRVGDGPSEQVIRRHSIRFPLTETDLGAGKVPRLYRSGARTYGEVSWSVDRRNRPVASVGLLRYPIAFPVESASSGAGFDISAPFLAGRSRHALSEDDRNQRLIDAARVAFGEAAGRGLAKLYGPRFGVLVQSDGRVDNSVSDKLAALLVTEGGLSVCGKVAGKSFDTISMRRSEPLVLACSQVDLGKVNEGLCLIARDKKNVLHPLTPSDLVSRIARVCPSAILLFDEKAAALETFVEKISQEVDEKGVKRFRDVLEALERLRKESGSLRKDLTSELTEKGKLPVVGGGMHLWKAVRRSKSGFPSVPGIKDPNIIHPDLADAAVLVSSPARLKEFKLDEFLHKKDFKPVNALGRQNFFDWLKFNASAVTKARLTEIADYPIWPGRDGVHRPLADYCRPKDRHIASVMTSTCIEPSGDVVTLAASKAAKGSLKLRTQPIMDEYVAWYNRAMEAVTVSLSAADQLSAARNVEDIEKDLATLLARGVAVDEVARQHRTVAQDGTIHPIDQIHEVSSLISACALPAEYLCRPGRTELHRKLGARTRPTREALVEALRRDPTLPAFFIRLDQYRKGGHDLQDLAEEHIVPTSSGVFKAADLAFKSDRDLWGGFKIKLEKLTSVPADHDLLVSLGVTAASLKGGQSPAFFEWLSKQSKRVQQEHLPQILRHWRDVTNGPVYWAPGAPGLKCIPVRGKDKVLELIALTEAVSPRNHVYVDDFPDLSDAALASGLVRLAIDTDNKHASVIGDFAAVGIRSLRRQAPFPTAVTVREEAQVPSQLINDLRRLQSPRVAASLKSRLPKHGVALSDIRNDIKNLVRGITGVRFGQGLVATYELAGKRLEITTASAVDATTTTVFVNSEEDPSAGFFSALVGYLFRAGATPQNAWGLMMAVREKRPGDQLSFLEEDDGDTDGDAEDVVRQESAMDIGDDSTIRSGHGAQAAVQMTPQAPRPKPFSPISKATYLQSRRGGSTVARKSTTDAVRNSLEEQEHIRALKEEHYAWHCQACIGTMEVLKAAPPGTYVYSPGFRRRLIEAHHVTHLQNAGGLGASNLLLLCQFHHTAFGDELSRDTVLEGLRKAARTVRRFPVDLEGARTNRREGLLASVSLSKQPFTIGLFFTQEHAESWLADVSKP